MQFQCFYLRINVIILKIKGFCNFYEKVFSFLTYRHFITSIRELSAFKNLLCAV
nr:MAG TPA: hypothetical protein [Bacteriophage sp.]